MMKKTIFSATVCMAMAASMSLSAMAAQAEAAKSAEKEVNFSAEIVADADKIDKKGLYITVIDEDGKLYAVYTDENYPIDGIEVGKVPMEKIWKSIEISTDTIQVKPETDGNFSVTVKDK